MSDESLDHITGYERYVIKVDQAVKGRFKKGLVKLDVPEKDIATSITHLSSQGYRHFIVEPYIAHDSATERYVSIIHDRTGYSLAYSSKGGVEIESYSDSVKRVTLDDQTNWSELAQEIGIAEDTLQLLNKLYRDEHFVFLEINPYIITLDKEIHVLDVAVEVDDAGIYFTQGWEEKDIRNPHMTAITQYEETVHLLDNKSAASFNLSVLNPNGSIFLLLSGGGASVVIADEVFNRGLGDQLANYGEYSGNPTTHESYIYANEVLKLLLASAAKQKVLFIGGAVANFTDIASTFTGVIMAITENAVSLRDQKVKIFVRRGGPRQEIGLAKMQTALELHGLMGGVYDPKTSITDALAAALKEVI